MNTVLITNKDIAHGRKRLAKALNKARNQPNDPEACTVYSSLEAVLVHRHVRIKNLLSLVLREEKEGQWFAYIILKKVPDGLPDTIGTKSDARLSNKREAFRVGCAMVNDIYQSEKSGKKPVFTFETPSFIYGNEMVFTAY